MVFIQAYPSEEAQDLEDFAKDFLDGFIKEGSVPANSTGIEKFNGYESMTVRLTIEGLPHVCTYVRKAIGSKVGLVMAQITEEDHSKAVKGFEIIFSSLKFDEKHSKVNATPEL